MKDQRAPIVRQMLPVLLLWQNRAMPTAPLRLTVAVLVLAASSLPASAGDRYDPGRAAFEVMVWTIITNALRPRYQPPPI